MIASTLFSCPLLQLETVVYAMMRFKIRLEDGARAGFFLGDVSERHLIADLFRV